MKTSGFYGKIPARGDFVSAGLPSAVSRTWDRIISAALTTTTLHFSDRWSDIWLEAPVWRFTLSKTLCGTAPLMGLWMPSIDKAGRHFPLMIAATCPRSTAELMARHGTTWLDNAEDAGRAAIADDLTPEQLKARIPSSPDLIATSDLGLPFDLKPRPGAGLWWTDGAPRVPAHGLVLDTMPDGAVLVAMLEAEAAPGAGPT